MAVETKRVAALLALGSGLGGSLGGCIAKSPVVGEDNSTGGVGGSGSANGGSGGGTGNETGANGSGVSGDLVGNTTYFVKAIPGSEGQVCLPRKLPIDADGNVACMLYRAEYVVAGGECSCDTSSAAPARPVIDELLASMALCGGNTGIDCADYCVCGVPQAEGERELDCLNDPNVSDPGIGWCYVDPGSGRGSAELISECPATQPQILRVFPEAALAGERDVYVLACVGGSVTPRETERGPRALGAPCVPSSEREPTFNGFALGEINLEFGSPDCASNICLVNHFQGRASCPYGQPDPADDNVEGQECFVPGTDVRISVPVDAQLVERRAEKHVICSCRCDGPDPSASYCACPSDMECAEIVHDTGVSSSDAYEGSYCIPRGTLFDPLHLPAAQECSVEYMNCGDAP